MYASSLATILVTLTTIAHTAAATSATAASQSPAAAPSPQLQTEEHTVHCNRAGSIQHVLDQLQSKSVQHVITITGTCRQPIDVRVDNVTLQGPHPERPSTNIVGQINIVGASNVILKGVAVWPTIMNVGVYVTKGASLHVENSKILDHAWAGVGVLHNSSVSFKNTTIRVTESGWAAVFAFHNSTITASASRFVSASTTPLMPYLDVHGPAIGAYASSHVSLFNSNTLVHSNRTFPGSAGLAIELDNKSSLTASGLNEVKGHVMVARASMIGVRGTRFIGRQTFRGSSHASFGRDASISGSVIVEKNSFAEFETSFAGVTGTVVCRKFGKIATDVSGLNLSGC